jgi:hypothetical protein
MPCINGSLTGANDEAIDVDEQMAGVGKIRSMVGLWNLGVHGSVVFESHCPSLFLPWWHSYWSSAHLHDRVRLPYRSGIYHSKEVLAVYRMVDLLLGYMRHRRSGTF